MNDRYEVRKRFAILGWVAVSTLFLWLASMLPNDFDIGSFFDYLLLLYGGGFAFHFLTELLNAPASEDNWGEWGELVKRLAYVAFVMISVLGVAYFEKYVLTFGCLLLFVAVFLAVWHTITQAEKVHAIILLIKDG